MAYPRYAPDRAHALGRPGASAALLAAAEVAHRPTEELREIVVRFSAFREAHPDSGISLLEFAVDHLGRVGCGRVAPEPA